MCCWWTFALPFKAGAQKSLSVALVPKKRCDSLHIASIGTAVHSYCCSARNVCFGSELPLKALSPLFRSPNWSSLDHKAEAVAFASGLWRWVLSISPATLFVTMGKRPAEALAPLLGARHVARLGTGWGKQAIDVWDSPTGRRIVGMPHPSRYTLFNRRSGASDLAESSFREATDLQRQWPAAFQ